MCCPSTDAGCGDVDSMAAVHQFRNHALALVFGLVMVGSATVGTHGPALAVTGAAAIAMGMGIALRQIATLAVLLSVFTIVLSDPSPLLAALSGLCAAGYLLCRYSNAVIGKLADTCRRPRVHLRRAGRDLVPAPVAVAAVGGAAGCLGDLRGGHAPVHKYISIDGVIFKTPSGFLVRSYRTGPGCEPRAT